MLHSKSLLSESNHKIIRNAHIEGVKNLDFELIPLQFSMKLQTVAATKFLLSYILNILV